MSTSFHFVETICLLYSLLEAKISHTKNCVPATTLSQLRNEESFPRTTATGGDLGSKNRAGISQLRNKRLNLTVVIVSN